MYIVLVIIFSIWVLLTCIYILKPKLLGKFRLPLHRFGFFANWSMYVPNQDKVGKTYSLMYRDRDKNGELKDWVEFTYPGWHPFIFILNTKSRLNSVFSKCVSVLIRMSQQGNTELNEDSRFLYLCEIICSHQPRSIGSSRQVQLKYNTLDGPDLLICESDFTLLR